MRPPLRPLSALRVLALVSVGIAGSTASAQTAAPRASASPLEFGSADDLFERGSGRVESERTVASVFVGAGYLPDTWRGALRGRLEGERGPFSASVAATLHPAAGGLYGPEADEPYDGLRAIDYVRFNPSPGRPVYVRLGPTEHVTLGAGALARSYRTTTAWDERTLGAEASARVGRATASAFLDDVQLSGVVGGEVDVRTPFAIGPLQDARLALGVVHDLGLPQSGDSSLTGVEATLRASLGGGRFAADAPFGVTPFVTAARYLGHGGTLGAGADVDAFRFSDALRARARVAVFASSSQFVPGYVGPFYSVSNARERIVTGLTTTEASDLVGTPLDSLGAGVDVVLDLRFVAFGRFEVSQHVRRHIGRDRASAYSLRLAARLPQRARAELAIERQGFRGLFGFLNGLGDENTLVFDVAAPVGRGAQAFVRSRYGYRRLRGAAPDRFLAERRFEPLVGVRVGLR